MDVTVPKPPTSQELLEQALLLPKGERLRLADRILKSIDDEGWPADVHPAWKSEIAVRLQGVKDGTAVTFGGAEHMRRLREKYGA